MGLRNSWSYPHVADELEDAEFSISVKSPPFVMTASTGSAFESASLSFSSPLVLPSVAATTAVASTSQSSLCPHVLALALCNCPSTRQKTESPTKPINAPVKQVRFAPDMPVALPSDLYTTKKPAEIEAITAEIDSGLFVGPDSWLPGKKHHPGHYDVRKVLVVINKLSPASSYSINMSLLSMCRTRIAAILRQLKIQGIIEVQTKAKV